MGFLGGDSEPSNGERLIDEELANSKAEMEAKKQSLYATRLDIIKGQGSEQWSADRTSAAPTRSNTGKARGNLPFGLGDNPMNRMNPRR